MEITQDDGLIWRPPAHAKDTDDPHDVPFLARSGDFVLINQGDPRDDSDVIEFHHIRFRQLARSIRDGEFDDMF